MAVVFDKDLTLKEKMREYSMELLKNYARDFEIKGFSKMKKNELAERVAEELLKPDVMFYRMSIFDDKDIKLFERGFNGKIDVGDDDEAFEIVCKLNDLNYIALSRGVFLVPCDVLEAWKKIRTDEFERYRKRSSWVWKCVHFAEELYGVCPVENLLDVVNAKKGIRMNAEELADIYDHFPYDQLWSSRIDNLIVSDVYSSNLDALKDLRMSQGNKPYYVPTPDEVEELYRTLALVSENSYQDLNRYLKNDLFMDPEEAYDIVNELWDNVSTGDDYQENLQWLLDQLDFERDDQAEKVINLFMECMNNTRLISNRGFKPTELFSRSGLGPGNMPTIVPGSSHAAKMLAEAAPQIRKMGFGVDVNGNSVDMSVMSMPMGMNGPVERTTVKVYPNDPCPCGSGKKFKKCCGKNV